MMSSYYSDFVGVLKSYCSLHNLTTEIEQKLSVASIDSANKRHFESLSNDLDSVSMDNIAKDVVRVCANPDSRKTEDSPASVDSFLIDESGVWYFIEFKNQKVGRTKEKCMEKSYANIFWLVKILLEMKKSKEIQNFDYEDPFSFIKRNCVFILVIGNGCDDKTLYDYRERKKAGEELPDNCKFIEKLETYVFNKAVMYSESQFEDFFVKKFRYE